MLEREEIEAQASRLLAQLPGWIWDGHSLPVPVEHIADSSFGLAIRDVDDLRSAPGVPELPDGRQLSGLLLPGLGEIWVNASEAKQWPGRRRFTVGHELGHWCLHREGSAGTTVWCREASVAPDDPGETSPRPGEESEANLFAAALLMPPALVRREYERLGSGGFGDLCAEFGVSGAAMGRRLHAVV